MKMQPSTTIGGFLHGLQAPTGFDAAGPSGPIDDLLDHFLTSLPSSPWPDFLASASAMELAGDHAETHPSQLLLPGSACEFLDGGCQDRAISSCLTALNSLPQGQPQGSLMITGQTPAPNGAAAGGGAASDSQLKQKVRARRGQATDPHSIAERLRRVRISEKMKALQELVPNANKTDKASMLEEIIEYVKFLRVQVKLLSMSRLGGMSRPTSGSPIATHISSSGAGGRRLDGDLTANPGDGRSLSVTEQEVAKLMEDDMGSAMQYLQGKGLCLMPISLAATISAADRSRRSTSISSPDGSGPSSPSVLMPTA